MKYKLLKNLPWIKAWAIIINTDSRFEIKWDECGDNYLFIMRQWDKVEWWAFSQYPDFFEPINERVIEYPNNLMQWYVIYAGYFIAASNYDVEIVENYYIIWNRFPTEENAKAYLELKKDVARFNMFWREKYFNEFYIDNEDWPHREEVDLWKQMFHKINIDFILPTDATEEEQENRVKLLKAFYWF